MKNRVGENNEFSELRCKKCGKLLFKCKINSKVVDKKKQYVNIVSRCSRCKHDNEIFL